MFLLSAHIKMQLQNYATMFIHSNTITMTVPIYYAALAHIEFLVRHHVY